MPLGLAVIQDLAVVLILAFLAATFFARRNQPIILSYLLVGALIGPSALGIVSNLEVINLFADLGIILLMFSIGLEFNLNRLKRVGTVAVFAGTLEMLFMLGLGNTIGKSLGWSYTDSIFLGGILAISSTAIIAKMLRDMRSFNEEYAQIILGILIVQDIGAVILLTFFGGVATLSTFNLQNVLLTVFNIFLFFLITLPIGIRFVPRIVDWIRVKIGSNEILLLTSLGFCFALAIFSSSRGFSVALGAFMAGVILAESSYDYEIRAIIRPIRDMFTTIFFVSIGMLLDLIILRDNLLIALFVFLIVALGRVLSCGLGTYLSGYGGRTSMYVGIGLIPLGEFSLVMAKQGHDLGIVDPALYQVTVATTILSIAATPYLLKSTPVLTERIDLATPLMVKEFLKYLTSWVTLASRQLQFDTEVARAFKNKFLDIVINILVIVTIWLLVFSVSGYVPQLPVEWLDVKTASILVAIILSLPSAYIILRRIQGLIDLFLDVMGEKFELFGLPEVKNAIRNVSFIFIGMIIAINVFPLLMMGIARYNYVILGFLFVAIASGGYLFWQTITKFQVEMEGMIRRTVLTQEGKKTMRSHRRRMMESLFEGIMENKIIDQVEIGEGSPVIGKSIAETELRSRTGTTILSIERDGNIINNPGAKEVLQSGDLVALMGNPEERERARRVLTGE
jgi:CPA2 family monovalent cation:H+ antiporter-2